MIPVSLQLKNFMSYGDPPILDFRDFHMACLCGNNGHGKSAIIDAITWALWGEGRKASIEKKPDEGLLKIGKTEMMVEFIFDVEGDRYRVIRHYSKSGKTSKSNLEFDIYSPQSGEYTGLTQKSVTLTQEKINQFLRMDYETFINSCVLLQGRADEFAIKKAGERKQLLADILGLSRYDELSTMAREKYKEANMRVTLIEEEKEKLAEEIFQKENVLERLEDININLRNLNKEIEDTEKELLSLRDKKSKLSVIREKLTEMEQHTAREEASLKDLKKQETHLKVDRERIEKIVTEEKNIMEQCHNYEELIREEASMVEKLQKTTGLKQKKYSLENKINQKRNEITYEIKIFLEKINSIKIQLNETAHIIEEKTSIEEGYKFLKELEEREKETEEKLAVKRTVEEKKREIEKKIYEKEGSLKIELATLENQLKEQEKHIIDEEKTIKEIEVIKEEIKRLEVMEKEKEIAVKNMAEKQSMIPVLERHIKDIDKELDEERKKWKSIGKASSGVCPYCNAPFDEKRKKSAMEKIKKQGEEKKEKKEKILGEIEILNKEIAVLIKQQKNLDASIKNIKPERDLIGQKQLQLSQSKKTKELIREIKEKIEEIIKNIGDKTFILEEIRELSDIEKKLCAYTIDEQDLRKIKSEREKFTHYGKLKFKLDMATENREKLIAQMPELEKQLKVKEDILKKDDFSHDLKKQLEEINIELNNTGYSQEEHNITKEKIKKLSGITTKKVLLEEAKKQFPLTVKKLEEITASIKEKEILLTKMKEDKELNSKRLEELPSLIEIIPQREFTLQGLRLRAHDLAAEKGTLESLRENFIKIEGRIDILDKEFEEKGREREIYKILNKAFSKDGIQALIIQNSIPEIEGEANKILSRLTDNRIHIALELQRDKKSGGLKDTLDIKISDESGTRDYELYSGGEAFRTNFSLRIALAKLMARRSGTKLRTLIIDEGFGTQDSEGIEQLVQAINEISRDFDKILVITHMEHLKNMFPTKIEVSKSPLHGSTFTVTSYQ